MKSVSNTRTTFKKIFTPLLVVSLLFNCFTEFRSVAQILPENEVAALKTISEKLGIKDWNTTETFCSSGNVSEVETVEGKFLNALNITVEEKILTNVTCNCNNTVCHVTNIQLMGQNLTGEIPAEFANLSYLQEIDLTRNYINGTIPASFAQLSLTNLSLSGNRISGSIPGEIGDIATLVELVLENNQLGGPLPPNLGNLSRLRRLRLSANNFNGTLPEEFSKLKNLIEFTIDGSKLSGKIPNWIGNWILLERLDMQGTFMEGPLPSNISLLKNLTELRISDLNGSISRFPDLRDMKNLKILILRNCLINGAIPDYIGDPAVLTALKTLDLSFNRLTGEIPETFRSSDLDYMFLNNNSLNGTLPEWTRDRRDDNIDVSYNNFTEAPGFVCGSSELNVASSISSSVENNLNTPWCLKKDLPCPNNPQYHSLFINCGGSISTTFEGDEYIADSERNGPSQFYVSQEKWAYSSTGVFMGKSGASYKANNSFSLDLTDEIYKTARLAPTSLRGI